MDRLDVTLSAEAPQVIEAWKATPGVHQVTSEDGHLSLLVDDSNLVLPRLFEAVSNTSIRLTSVEIHEPNLEAVFLHLTGRALRD
jgi:ABC-2 type transport system ATP-binding protein